MGPGGARNAADVGEIGGLLRGRRKGCRWAQRQRDQAGVV